METSSFLPAKSKLEAVARLYAAAQAPAEPLGPGSKEKKSVLTKTAERLSLDVDESAPKDVLARQILEGKTPQDGMDLGLKSYSKLQVSPENPRLFMGAGWIAINKDNVDNYNF